ncbi:MAG: hypothetical protein RBR97_17555 [Bacteroidales bacterium]|nr:hypothetical protein [Bacteroidales bacterium]
MAEPKSPQTRSENSLLISVCKNRVYFGRLISTLRQAHFYNTSQHIVAQVRKRQRQGSRSVENQGTDERSKCIGKACFDYALQGGRRQSQFAFANDCFQHE